MQPLLRREARLTLAAVVLAGCGGSEPRIPTTLSLSPGTVAFTALGQTQQLSPSVSDQNGDPLSEVTIAWTSSNEGIASVSSTGLVTAQGAGTAQVTASAGSATASVSVSVAQNPTQMSKISGDGQSGPAGATLGEPIVVEVEDALGNPVAGVTVLFTPQGGGSVDPASAVTGADGRASTVFTTGTAAGTPQSVTVTIPATAISVSFSATAVAGAPASLSMAAGHNQSAGAGQQVPVRPTIVLRDANDNPVAGVAVEFEVISGGGTITGASTTTDASGKAEVGSWTLGAGPNVLRATAAGNGIACNPANFAARLGSNPFRIDLRFLSCATPAQILAFTDAQERWESLITGDVENVAIDAAPGECDDGTPALTGTIDDVIIFATIAPIDGAGSVLGQAGPCFIRDPGFLPAVGVMFFDSEDLDFVQGEGLLEALITHEMAHVLGFGTLWPFQNLLEDAAALGGTDPHFTGPQAITAFDAAGGSGYTDGLKVPVENDGSPGTVDSHWRESIFATELMTGFVDIGSNPLSAVSVAALADQGYTVDLSGADAFTLSLSALRVASGPRLRLLNDVRRLPIKVVDKRGRLRPLRR